MRIPIERRSSRALVAFICSIALFAGMHPPPATGAHAGSIDCPPIMPASELNRGMVATGFTVSRGRTPEPFSAEVLGVLPDGIGPGRDLIIVEASGDAIDRAGGIWFGMSGSPVYFQQKLIGAVSFGLTWGPSKIAGLTPAADIAALLDLPASSGASAGASPSFRSPSKVKLSDRWVDRIASRTGASSNEVGSTMERLKTPLAISGMGSRGMGRLRRIAAREGLPFVPYASGTSSTLSSSTGGVVEAGDNFAAALSYGDITFAGVGTTTMVCDSKVVAFGHPFFWDGRTTMGANAADTITIVDDPLFGAYKLATIAEGVGTVDQDRLAGIRAVFGPLPTTIPITSKVASIDNAGSRVGNTEGLLSSVMPFLTFIHMFTNIDVTYDQISGGSSLLAWQVTGTRASGEPWRLTRANRYVSDFDISFASLFELEMDLFALLFNRFETIEFTSVDVDATVEEDVKTYTVYEVFSGRNGGPLRIRDRIRVRPGATIQLRVFLTPKDGSDDRVVDLQVKVPRRAPRRGSIQIGRGNGNGGEEGFFFECFFFGEDCAEGNGDGIQSFDELLDSLQEKSRNDELLATLRLGGLVRSRDAELLDQVVRGRQRIRVIVRR